MTDDGLQEGTVRVIWSCLFSSMVVPVATPVAIALR